MNRFHFQDEEALEAQRMTNEEAEAIVRLWAERERLSSLPTVQDVADGLQIPAQEAAALLLEVRATRARQTRRAAQRAVLFRRKLNPLAVAIAVSALVFLLGIVLVRPAGVQSTKSGSTVPTHPVPSSIWGVIRPIPSILPEGAELRNRKSMRNGMMGDPTASPPPITDDMPRGITPMTR